MPATAHTLLRDRRAWLGDRRGLLIDRDGHLELARVPGPADGKPVEIDTAYPYARAISGLALGPCGALFVADTARHRVACFDARCAGETHLPAHRDSHGAPGHLDTPCGLAVCPEGLWVADRGHDRLQRFAFPRLEPHFVIEGVRAPTSIATDAHGRVLVIDADDSRLRRFLSSGAEDAAFSASLEPGRLGAPHCVATREDGTILVSDTLRNAVLLFDADGRFMRELTGTPGWLPGAIAAAGNQVCVADAASGAILFFVDDVLLGPLPGWRGAVSALALASDGALTVKPGLDARVVRLAAEAAHLTDGELLAGPFDAGEEERWERAWVEARIPADTGLALDVAVNDDGVVPDASAWRTLPGTDALLALPGEPEGRFAWLRVRLHASAGSAYPGSASPVLCQVRLATAAEDYLDYLPLTYRRNDRDGFLSRWLRLLRGEFLAIEESVDLLSRIADPDFVPGPALPWLAQWLGLELPASADESVHRALIAQAVDLQARRGTPASIARFVELHTGIRPAIVEAFAQRRIWVLGVSSRLDFDTRLPALEPAGMVLPDAQAPLPCPGPIGSAVVGATGPLAAHQSGTPLFDDEAHRFCVVVDAARVCDPEVLAELHRIVEREKPAHTDFRVQAVVPQLLVGLQSRIGIDAIVGEEQASRIDAARLGIDLLLPSDDASRAGRTSLDGTLTLA